MFLSIVCEAEARERATQKDLTVQTHGTGQFKIANSPLRTHHRCAAIGFMALSGNFNDLYYTAAL